MSSGSIADGTYIGHGRDHAELKPFIEACEQVLKPCPFCGSRAELENTHTPSYWVRCTECEGEQHGLIHQDNADIHAHRASIENAVKAWNTRFGKPERGLTQRLKALKEAFTVPNKS